MKRSRFRYLFLVSCILFGIAFSVNIYQGNYMTNSIDTIDDQPKLAETFELTIEFEPSTYYISPESSPGINDGVFFSFEANQNGNYTIQVKNFPKLLTQTAQSERYVSFDNPSGTDLWYACYAAKGVEILEDWTINLLTSEDLGETWNSTTITMIPPEGGDPFEIENYIMGTAIAADPKNGVFGIVYWTVRGNLTFICSTDNGTSWSEPKTIAHAKDIGNGPFFNPMFNEFPTLEIAILKNSTMYVLTETPNFAYSGIVYIESHDNGTNWSGIKNIKISEGSRDRKPIMQVDRTTGDYWLFFYKEYGIDFNVTWAQFMGDSGEGLNISVPTQLIKPSISTDYNFDFYFEYKTGLFKLIEIWHDGMSNYELINWTCSSFGSPWNAVSMGYHEDFEHKAYWGVLFNIVTDGTTYHIIFDEYYTGNNEVYQYIHSENSTFWERKGLFAAYELRQDFWNGRVNDMYPINITMVKVKFYSTNGTVTENRSLFINIDNEPPDFDFYQQVNNYFNPLSGDMMISAEVNWDIDPTEEVTSYLQVFRNDSKKSEWQRITNNNWQDSNPRIIQSQMGQLYIIYQTLESGRKLLNLMKSNDQGVTWSNPVTIFQSFGDEEYIKFTAAAWAEVVAVYVRDESDPDMKDILYRSFDEGETFQDPLNVSEAAGNSGRHLSKLVFNRSGTLFACYMTQGIEKSFWVTSSDDIGLNWQLSKEFQDGSANFPMQYDPGFQPDLIYDSENDSLHLSMPVANNSVHGPQYAVMNCSFATLNLRNGVWGDVKSVGINYTGFVRSEPKLLITRDSPSSPTLVRAIYLNNSQIIQGEIVNEFMEIISSNSGVEWGPRSPSTMDGLNFVSNVDEIFYVKGQSDGNDQELYFRREGRLVRSQEEYLSSTEMSAVTFDGLDDFEETIEDGNYTYKLRISDYAGNSMETSGWFYADSQQPVISEWTTNWSEYDDDPIPRHDVNITVKITDETGISASLIYENDSMVEAPISMNDIGNGYYSAIIPGDQVATTISYWIEASDDAQNKETISDWGGIPFSYDMPSYSLDSVWTFNENETYSQFEHYNLSIKITQDLKYITQVLYRYSYDGKTTWNDSVCYQNDDIFWINITNIPSNLYELYYQIIVEDVFDEQTVIFSSIDIEFHEPTYAWSHSGLFNETQSYSSSQNYTFTITITDEEDLNYIDSIIFYYSLDNGTTWHTLEFQQTSPTYVASLTNISEDTREMLYKVILIDIYGTQTELTTDTQQIEFYPEIPIVSFNLIETLLIVLISIGVGMIVAYGYIRLKHTSREIIHKQIIISRLYEEMEDISLKEKAEKKVKRKERKEMAMGATPFTKAYIGILCGSIVIFIIGFLLSNISALVGILLLALSLLMGIFGYTILMSRDITANIYFEKIRVRLFMLELFQIILLFFNILAILDAGSRIPWFYYYLIESTYDLGIVEIPKLYVSVIGVFFTSLVLVIVITYLQLRNAVRSLREQRQEGASDNLLLYNKDQTSSRMITQMGFKTVIFLVSVLIAIITTTNLLTIETGILLLVLIGPFALSCFLVLMIHPVIEKRSKKGRTLEEPMPFIDSKKFCSKCGEGVFLADKYCTSCGEQLVFPHKMGTYLKNCDKCGGRLYETAEYCPNCGVKIKNEK